MSASFWHQIKFARTKLSALLFPRPLNPPDFVRRSGFAGAHWRIEPSHWSAELQLGAVTSPWLGASHFLNSRGATA